MKETKRLLDVQQTVAVLVRALGNPVAWSAWLADIRRTPRPGKTPPSLYGCQLHPYASGDKKAPLYRPLDVQIFIAAVRAEDAGIGATDPALYDFDSQPGPLPWQCRHARHVAAPVAPLAALKRAA